MYLDHVFLLFCVTFCSLTDSASKHALQGYFNSLRVELLKHNIQVTIILPGYINTRLSANALTADGSKHQGMIFHISLNYLMQSMKYRGLKFCRKLQHRIIVFQLS